MEIIPVERGSVALGKIIERAAFTPDFDVVKLQALLSMKLEYEANEARLAYITAMHEFRSNPPDINKTKKVEYKNRDNSITTYYHAELDNVVEIISEALRKVEIRPSWRTSESEGKIVVTCVLTHKQGHSEDVASLPGPPDMSGGKNNVQAIGSTVTYLQRYTLLAGTGLAAKGQDDDGKTDGIATDDVQKSCDAMREAKDVDALMSVFRSCYEKAKNLNDKISMGTFIDVYNDCKKALSR